MYFKAAAASFRTVVFLGAGASFGESLYDRDPMYGLRPPVDADFLDWCLLKCDHSDPDIAQLFKLACEMMGRVSGVGLEQLVTRLEATNDLHVLLASGVFSEGLTKARDKESLASGMKRTGNDSLAKDVEAANRAISKALSMANPLPRMARPDSDHNYLAECLEPADAILSFNYDTLIDSSVLQASGGLWQPSAKMYGVPVGDVPKMWRRPGQRLGFAAVPDSFRLLKLHGSIHFEDSSSSTGSDLKLSQQAYATSPLIVPPLHKKDIQPGSILGSIWQQAISAVEKAEAFLVVGYSCPGADFLASALLAFRSPEPRSVRLVAIINPNADDTAHILALIKSTLASSPEVIHEKAAFSDLKELTQAWKPPTERAAGGPGEE